MRSVKSTNYFIVFNFIVFIFIYLSSISVTALHAQKTNDEYWKATLKADDFYDQEMYKEAAEAYKIAFTKNNVEDFANDRLRAATANCMIDNEDGVKENLNKMIPVSSKGDMRKVLVNYEIFNKYKDTDWWKNLEFSLNDRLAKLIAHHKNLKIFNKEKNYKYAAIRINAKGDTLANTFVTLVPNGTGWGDEAATTQSQAIFVYEYTEQDSLDHIGELTEVVLPKFWIKSDTTGIIENEKKVWMHPIRNNEFFKTELAPFPSVIFPISDENIEKANSSIMILREWGTYSPSETYCTYNYEGMETRKYKFNEKLNCHRFRGDGLNDVHGLSSLIYYFHEDYGFTEMIYTTYDGDTILFEMEEVVAVLGE